MVTTIQIHENVKRELDLLKEEKRKTYEEIILELIRITEQQKRKQKSLLIEGYKEMANESLKITKEWFAAGKDWD